MKNKTLYILIGPKGAGKTHIGKLMENEYSIKFLMVEPIFIKSKKNNESIDGFEIVIDNIKKMFEQYNEIVIEATGASDNTKLYFEKLRDVCDTYVIRVEAPLELCKKRVLCRSKEDHLKVSDVQIDKINKFAEAKRGEYKYDLIVKNTNEGDEEIKRVLSASLLFH